MNQDAIDAAVRRDEKIAQNAQTAIESQQKFFEPKELKAARLAQEKEDKLHDKLARAANKREEQEQANILKAIERQNKIEKA